MVKRCNLCGGSGKLGFQQEDCCSCFGEGFILTKEYSDFIQATEFNKDLCLTIAMEECSELIQAISKAKRDKLNLQNLVEEVADVLICLSWLEVLYFKVTDLLQTWLTLKQNRIVERLNKGEFN